MLYAIYLPLITYSCNLHVAAIKIFIMKALFFLIAAILLSSYTFAQEKTGWKELDKFHTMVPALLHTAIAHNLAPLKQHSAELLQAAKAWQASKFPKGDDTPKYKADLAELVKECAGLDTAVKNGSPDNDIIALADKTHKTFHLIFSETLIP